MSRLVSFIPVLALVSTLAVADAANEARPAAAVGSFETLDRNADRRLSRSEAGFDRVLSQVFADTDVDGDGFVSKLEYDAVLKKQYNVAKR